MFSIKKKYLKLFFEIEIKKNIVNIFKFPNKNSFPKKMSDFNPMDRVKKMVAAIRSEAKEKADQILDHGMQQFKLEKNKIINQQKDKVIQEYKLKMDQYSVQKRM